MKDIPFAVQRTQALGEFLDRACTGIIPGSSISVIRTIGTCGGFSIIGLLGIGIGVSGLSAISGIGTDGGRMSTIRQDIIRSGNLGIGISIGGIGIGRICSIGSIGISSGVNPGIPSGGVRSDVGRDIRGSILSLRILSLRILSLRGAIGLRGIVVRGIALRVAVTDRAVIHHVTTHRVAIRGVGLQLIVIHA
ncbi:hypothetical protein [Bifidobacterium mongoliense]|uniref:hypothetical protein n=1 Tax=Bifidobacterium mongoliense TaxID=518643 RepID=UPI003B50FFC3